MKKIIFLILIGFLAACTAEGPAEEASPETLPWYAGISSESLSAYQATFQLQFDGSEPWQYQLLTRSDGQALEHNLHIEGLPAQLNPGDLRAVIQNGTTRMIGPGTDNECIQFPQNLDIGPAFLSPDHLLAPALVSENLTPLEEAQISGITTQRYGMRQSNINGIRNVLVDIWWSQEQNAAMRFDLRLEGQDPIFAAGEGTLYGRYVVTDLQSPAIQPISGCEIDLPLPEGHSELVKLPGFLAFKSPGSPGEVVNFFQNALPPLGWESVEGPQEGPGSLLISYRRGDQTLEINLEEIEGGATVEVIFGP